MRSSSHPTHTGSLARARWAWAALAALILLILPLQLRAQSGGPTRLRVAVMQTASAPFVFWLDKQAVGGVDVEVAQAIANQLQMGLELIVLPRLRIDAAAAAGELDLVCHLNPSRQTHRDLYRWSPALLDYNELLVGHSVADPIDSPDEIPTAAIVGTEAGEPNALLEPRFADGRLKRDEAFSAEHLLRKLVAKRHPYGLLNLPTLTSSNYSDLSGSLAPWRLPMGQTSYHCGVPNKAAVEPRKLLAAIDQLRAAGRFAKLADQLTGNPLAVVVSTRSSIRAVERSQIAELFMGQRQQLPGGHMPVLLMSGGADRQQFLASALKRDATEFKAAWAAQQFGGRKRPPLELADGETVKAHLQRNANALGYVPFSLVDPSLRIVWMP